MIAIGINENSKDEGKYVKNSKGRAQGRKMTIIHYVVRST